MLNTTNGVIAVSLWCHPSAPFFVIRVADTGIYFACNSNCVLA
ncbi:hypothetical protein [Wolbachia endosymbiont (group A) of Ectemnius continuus]|nr:hypothetical protein [Wolbachia endosymbiont (group A) of Ectemnius continuus]